MDPWGKPQQSRKQQSHQGAQKANLQGFSRVPLTGSIEDLPRVPLKGSTRDLPRVPSREFHKGSIRVNGLAFRV